MSAASALKIVPTAVIGESVVKQFESAAVSELRAGRSHAGSRDDLTNAAVAG